MQRSQIEEFPGGVNIFTPYSKDFVEDLTAEIPFQYCHWDPERKCWRVDDPYVDDAVEITNRYFEQGTGAPRPVAKSSANHSLAECLQTVRESHPHHAELFLLPGAPVPLVEAAWRALSKLHHPDAVTGDLARMQRINVAHDRLSEPW